MLRNLLDGIKVITNNNRIMDNQGLDKVKQLRKIKEMNNLEFDIQVDGGVKKDNIKLVDEAGADIAVAGTAIFNSENSIQNNLQALMHALR